MSNFLSFIELTKPKVVLMMLVTAVVGMGLASAYHNASWQIYLYALLGIYLCSSSAAVINHVADRHIDAKMSRTQNRPVVQGDISPKQAIVFSMVLGFFGITILLYFVNVITTILTTLSLIGYAGIYTLYLKRATPQNIVIGGLAGALPPLLGWSAVTGGIHPNALTLCLIIFLWTPPHFWALAIARKEEYAKAGIPMLPVTHGTFYTKVHILCYTLLMIVSTMFPYLLGMTGLIYLIIALVLGMIFLAYAVALFFGDEKRIGMACFWYSILYLFLLFISMFIDPML